MDANSINQVLITDMAAFENEKDFLCVPSGSLGFL